MRHPAYPEYKNSSIAWIRAIPGHWNWVRLKRKFKIINGSTPQATEPHYWDGEITWVTPADFKSLDAGYITTSARKISSEGLNSCGATLVPSGSIVLTTRAPIGGVAQATCELCTNQGCKSLVLDEEDMHERFVFYVLTASTNQLNALGFGTTFMELSTNELGYYAYAKPLIEEEHQIAAFLDWKTGQIDALIAKKQALIEKLKEMRLAVITQAVTQGLDPTAPLRDSGIPWLGQVPVHWKVKRLRFACGKIEQGWSPQCESQMAEEDAWGVMKVGCVNGDRFDALENKALPVNLEPKPDYELRPGEILISRANTKELLGSAAIVPEDVRPKLLLCDKLFRIRPESDVNETFMTLYLRTPAARYQYEREATGASSSMQNIGQDTVKNLVVALPPLDEQINISCLIHCETAKLDGLIQKVESALSRLTEYRTALITAATTGQIDVRQVAIPGRAKPETEGDNAARNPLLEPA